MKGLKRNALIITVLLFVCVAVYLNWSYNRNEEADMVAAEDAAMLAAKEEHEATADDLTALVGTGLAGSSEEGQETNAEANTPVSDYFAQARLTRQQSRDTALGLLNQAASSEAATQEIIDSAMSEIAVMANYSMLETQIENLLIAKEFAECVVFLSSEGVTVAVPSPEEGLSAASVARVTDIITSETALEVADIKIIEVK